MSRKEEVPVAVPAPVADERGLEGLAEVGQVELEGAEGQGRLAADRTGSIDGGLADRTARHVGGWEGQRSGDLAGKVRTFTVAAAPETRRAAPSSSVA